MWDWKNNHIYRWRKRYQNNWTKVSLIHDKDNKKLVFQINDQDLGEKFGIQQSTISYEEKLKRYDFNPFWMRVYMTLMLGKDISFLKVK